MVPRLTLDEARGRYGDGPSPVATLGFFDGVHRGHQAVLAATAARAQAVGGDALVVTFDPHPRAVLTGRPPPLLTSLDERCRMFGVMDIAAVLVLPFDAQMAAVEARSFARSVFQDALGCAAVVVGARTRFGHGGRGTPDDLARWGPDLGFAVEVVPAVHEGGEPVSSTRIRDRVRRGDLDGALELLGHPWSWRGTVVRGDERGRTLGYPTANITLPEVVLPPNGVYAGTAYLDGVAIPAVANLGIAPTFGPDGPRRLEVHLIDWTGDCYGADLRFAVTRRLRDEQSFDGPDALRAQLARDVAAARSPDPGVATPPSR